MSKLREADKWFSSYQRLRSADYFGICKCSTCPAVRHWKNMQWGHWVNRESRSVRFDHRNGGVQCKQCNCALGGNIYIMALYIDWIHGRKATDKLLEKKKSGYKPDLDKIARVYKLLFERESRRRQEEIQRTSASIQESAFKTTLLSPRQDEP